MLVGDLLPFHTCGTLACVVLGHFGEMAALRSIFPPAVAALKRGRFPFDSPLAFDDEFCQMVWLCAAPTVSFRRINTWIKPAITIDIPGASQPKAEEGLYVPSFPSTCIPSFCCHTRAYAVSPLVCRVNVTFVNYAGIRTTLPGRVGDTLFDVARKFQYEFLDGM